MYSRVEPGPLDEKEGKRRGEIKTVSLQQPTVRLHPPRAPATVCLSVFSNERGISADGNEWLFAGSAYFFGFLL